MEQAMHEAARMLIAGFGVAFLLYAIYGVIRIIDRCREQRDVIHDKPVDDPRSSLAQFRRIHDRGA